MGPFLCGPNESFFFFVSFIRKLIFETFLPIRIRTFLKKRKKKHGEKPETILRGLVCLN